MYRWPDGRGPPGLSADSTREKRKRDLTRVIVRTLRGSGEEAISTTGVSVARLGTT